MNPVVEGVTDVDGKDVGDMERDIDGIAEGEGGEMVKAWAVVLLQFWCKLDCSIEQCLVVGGVSNVTTP